METKEKKDLLDSPYWVFDLDGTLTIPILDFPAMKRRLGLPTDRGILEMLNEMPVDRARKLHQELELIEHEMVGKAKIAPGARDLLAHLAEKGTRLGILTRNKKSHALRTLKVTRLQDYFPEEHVLGRDEARHKPDPDGVFKLMEAWQAPKDAAGVMVGDFMFDLQAGRSAGLETIYVDPKGEFPHNKYATVSIQSLGELLPRG